MKIASLALAALTLALGLTLSSVSEAGNESHGGGIERKHSVGPAWFMGKHKTIEGCVLVAPNFPLKIESEYNKLESLTQGQAELLVQKAFQKWIQYIDERGVEHKDLPDSSHFARTLNLKSSCDGFEDLRLYFGVSDATVERAKKNYRDPFAFAATYEGQSYKSTWRKGLLWVAPASEKAQWSRNRLTGILLHEIGHIFGNGHVPGTVMRDDLADNFGSHPQATKHERILQEIDQERVLLRGNARLKLTLKADDRFQYRLGFSFQKLLGRKAEGQIVETLEAGGYLPYTGTLTIGDSLGSKTFRITARPIYFCNRIGDRIFYIPRGDGGGSAHHSTNCSMKGKLIDDENGKSVDIAFSMDSDGYRYQMVLADEEDIYKNELFVYETMMDGAE